MKKVFKKEKGITLISLVVTIIILIILAGITIMLSKQNGLIDKTQLAKDETTKQEATEAMNLKITSIQIKSYAERKELPSLQYLADRLCEDSDMEYVVVESKKQANLNKIDVTNSESIYTKLKEYPYEFEIDKELRLASIDGVKVASNNGNSNTGNNILEPSQSITGISCTAEQNGADINVTINTTFAEGKNSNDVSAYMVIVNGKVYKYVNTPQVKITPLEPSTLYKIAIVAIDKDAGAIRSGITEITSSALSYTKQLLDYPVLTLNGICNVLYKCNEGEQYNYYDFDSSMGNTTASDSLPIEAYDRDESTYFVLGPGLGCLKLGNDFKQGNRKIKVKAEEVSAGIFIPLGSSKNNLGSNYQYTTSMTKSGEYKISTATIADNCYYLGFTKISSSYNNYKIYEIYPYTE